MKKLMNALKHELSLLAAASAFAFVCALAWGHPFVGIPTSLRNIVLSSGAHAQARTETLRGTVIRDGAQLLLRDSAGHVYRLDNAAQAGAYVGKTVTVTGQIDAAGRLIHVRQIEAHGV